MSGLYVAVNLESIETYMFPDVELYVRNGENYVLYKSHGRPLTPYDRERLKQSKIGFLYVTHGEMEVINDYMEASAATLLQREDLDARTKGKMMFQTSANYMTDLFANPDKVADTARTRRLMENLLTYIHGYPEVFKSLSDIMNHNYHVFVHSMLVSTLTTLLHSEAYALHHDEMLDVGIGTLLHDFGKTFVPREILNKRGRLDDAEIAIMKRHPEEGYQFLKDKGFSLISLNIVRMHHERINGTGYPMGLKETEITRSAQIAAIADVYCSLTVDMSGNRIMPPSVVIDLMGNQMKGCFNEQILSVLAKVVADEEEPQQQILL